MGNAQCSGQLIQIQNDTQFTLQKLGDPQVIHGQALRTPDEIPPNNPAYIKNSGRHGHTFGSEIWFHYRFVDTAAPGKSVWDLKIFSEGTYSRTRAHFAIQVFEDGKLMAQENLWDERFPRKKDSESRFRLLILEPKIREDLGDGFYEIPVKITEKPAESKREEKPESKPEEKPESKPEEKPESKPEKKPGGKPDSKPAENELESKHENPKPPESKPAVIENAQDVSIVVHNTTRHVVECSTEHLSQGKWLLELPKRIDAREKATAKASGVTAKGEPVFKLKIAGQKVETTWSVNFDKTDSGFESGEQELNQLTIQPSSYRNHEQTLCGNLIVTESQLPVFQELIRSLTFLLKPVHRKVIVLAVVAALILLFIGRMEWITLALAPVIPGIAGEAAKPMWKWFWDLRKEREGVTVKKKAVLNEQVNKDE